jgi:hypothetical protein
MFVSIVVYDDGWLCGMAFLERYGDSFPVDFALS